MQGPEDEGVVPRQAVRTEEQLPARPYGGKAMLRLLELLETQGLSPLAEAAASAATTDDVRTEAVAHARSLGLLSEAPPARRARPRKRTAAAEQDGEAEPAEEAGAAEAATPETVAATYAEVAADRTGPPTGTGPQWRSLGPWTVTNGQTYGSSRVNVSGRVSALAVDPGNPAHVLAGAANGGVWESRDRGASWAPRTDYATTLTVGALAFDPQRAGEGLLRPGRGRLVVVARQRRAALRGRRGILDAGLHGTVRRPGVPRAHGGPGQRPAPVRGDHGRSVRLDRRAAPPGPSGEPPRPSPSSGAPARGWRRRPTGLFRSTDNGTTWNAVTLPGAPASFVRLAVSTAPSNPTSRTPSGRARRGFPSPAAARSPPATCGGGPAAPGRRWRCRRGCRPGSPGTTGTSPPRPTGTPRCTAARSRCTAATCPGRRGPGRRSATRARPASRSTPTSTAIAFEPGNPNMVYAGCDGGLFRSPDRGITWVTLQQRPDDQRVRVPGPGLGLGALADRRHPGQRHQPLDRARRSGSTWTTPTAVTSS